LAISIPYTAVALLAALFNSIDQMVIGKYSEFEYLATFAVVQKIIILLFIPASIIQSYIFPHIATIKYTSSTNDYLGEYLNFALYSGIALSQICILVVEYIVMPFLIDKEYGDILDLMRIMILCLPFMYLHAVFWTLLIARRMTVVANLPATLIVLLVAVVDIIAMEYNQKEFLVWSPVWANILMLIGLACIYHRNIEKLVISDDIRKKFPLYIGLNVVLSFTANIPSVIESFARIAIVLYFLIEIWKMMRYLNLKNVITRRST
jgi:O-antigen/teichoic acid export membrane protein